jgi:phosphatidylglycerophosphate synthase
MAATHVREYRSPLAAAEKRLLIWIAHRLPAWVGSDLLTLVGLVSMLGAGLAFWAARWYPASLLLFVVALALNWFGDSLDGTVARVRDQQRPRYGYYVDHVIDIFGTFFLVGGMALSGFMSPLVALGLLVAYYMVSAEVFLATHARGVFTMAFMGFGPTELRIVLAVGALALLRSPNAHLPALGTFKLFDVGGVVAIAGLAVALVSAAVRNTRALYREEPLSR